MKRISIIILIAFLLSSCVSANPIIYFKDGSSVSCSNVEVSAEFTTCIHKTTFGQYEDWYRNDVIEKIVSEPAS